jgi:adenylate cyclase
MATDLDVEASRMLDGLEGQARTDRFELIKWLLGRGFTVDQIGGTVAAPLLLPSNRALGDDGSCVSARKICEATGLDLEVLQRLQRAAGLPRIEDPDAAVLLRVDAEAAARFKLFLDLGIDVEETVDILRVLTLGLGDAAERTRQAGLKALLWPGATEVELAQAIEAMASRAAPWIGSVVADLFLLRLRHSFETEAVNAAERAAGMLPGAREVTVAFADLVGFTRLGEEVAPEELEQVARRLADLSYDVAVAPVRFVKTIGDAVMLVSAEPAPLLDAVLDLASAAIANGLPPVRIGVASGLAISRAGDWFGSPVNVASRVTAAARPGAVLAEESARDAIGNPEGITWSLIGGRRLKGLSDEVHLYSAQRMSADG